MAIKALQKSVKKVSVRHTEPKEENVNKFISKGGKLAEPDAFKDQGGDHRLTLRIPKWLMDRVDMKRKERVGKISRNLWILEIIEKASKE